MKSFVTHWKCILAAHVFSDGKDVCNCGKKKKLVSVKKDNKKKN